jgi:PKD repeat protein
VNQAPTAAFTSRVDGEAVSVDGSASVDPDGTVAGYAWDFGDQTTGSGATASHAYSAAGTFTVRLTVTDDDGATGTVTHDVTVTDPSANPPQVMASDAFGRTLASGLGDADLGGTWTTTGTTSVSGGVGHVTVAKAGGTVSAFLNPVAVLDTDVEMDFTLAAMPTGGGTYLDLVGRRLENNDYRAVVKVKADGSLNLGVSRVVNGTETSLKSLTVPGLTYVPGTALVVRLDVSGSVTSTVAAKTWLSGTPEPAAWQVSATDSTADLQRAGGVGFLVYASGSSTTVPVQVSVDNLWVGPAGTEPERA